MPSPHQSNSPGWPGSHIRPDAVVPRSRGRLATTGAVTARALPLTPTFPGGLVAAPKPVVALCPRKVHTAGPGEAPRPGREDPEPQRPRTARRAEFRGPTLRIHPFTSERFHVLLNSLFKVLFNFPSRYLFAIGLGVIFSLTSSLRRTLGCTPKQPDSREKPEQQIIRRTGLSPSTGHGPSQGGLKLDISLL